MTWNVVVYARTKRQRFAPRLRNSTGGVVSGSFTFTRPAAEARA